MSTKRPPLLSDDDIMQSDSRSPAYEVRDHYEAARAKDAELIQMLVDALEGLVYLEFCNEEGLSSGAPTSKDWKRAFDRAQEQIDAAAAQGFKPSDQ